MVQDRGADRPRAAEVELRAFDRLAADREPAVVRLQHGAGRDSQGRRIDRGAAGPQVRMGPGSVRGSLTADVRRCRLHPQPVVRKRVLELEREGERIARLRLERVRHQHAAALLLGHRPRLPSDEAVDRVPMLGLRERQLVALAVELVRAVLDAVRPRDQHLPAARGALLLRAVAVQHLPLAHGIRAKPAADTDDDRALVAVYELRLESGGAGHVSSAWYCASSLCSSSLPSGSGRRPVPRRAGWRRFRRCRPSRHRRGTTPSPRP